MVTVLILFNNKAKQVKGKFRVTKPKVLLTQMKTALSARSKYYNYVYVLFVMFEFIMFMGLNFIKNTTSSEKKITL